MIYRVDFLVTSRQSFSELPPQVKREVKVALRFLSQFPYGGEPLKDELEGNWKFRVGRYRIVYRLEPAHKTLVVIAVGHRRDIYQKLK